MKHALIASLLLILIAIFLIPIMTQCEQPVTHAFTQGEMNESAAADLKKAELKMADLLKSLHLRAKDYPKAEKKLRAAQNAWASYRDLQIEALWPRTEANCYGSVHGFCILSMKTEFTETRIKQLEAMLSTPEGDVCLSLWP